jgi:hypothetical protein
VTSGKTKLIRLGVGAVFLLVGIGLVVMWSAFAAMYVPECSTFSIHAGESRCRNPVRWVYTGYLLIGAGTLTIGYEVLRRVREFMVNLFKA